MNILFVAQRVPYPPNKGDKIRSFHEIKFLSQTHDISLVCLADNERDLLYEKELKHYCQSVDIVRRSSFLSNLRSLLYLFSNTPLSLPYFYSKALQNIVRQKIRGQTYDLIFVYCSSMAQYVELVHDIPKVIDFVDVDSEKWAQYAQHSTFPKNWIYRSESKHLRKYEELIAKTFQHCFLVSEREVEDFHNLVSPCPTMTSIVNSVDLEMFQPSQEPYEQTSLVFMGDMSYFANVESVLYLAREILPRIREIVPEVKFYVVGRNPAEPLQKLAEQNAYIIVTGEVENIQPYVKKSAVFVAPMRIARGIQNKILEAMAMGVPVVTNSLGFEGITALPEKDLFVEDTPEGFAQQVIQLMIDPELRKKISANARKTIEEGYNWNKNLEKLEEILVEVVK